MSQQNETGVISVVAGAARAAYLRVYDNGGTWTTAGAANQADGVQQVQSLAATDIVPIKISNSPGTRKMMADGVIAVGAAVYAGATGYVSGAGSIIEGRALEAAATVGDIIEVLPLHNADVPSTAGVSTPTVTFNGATGANEIRLPTNLADALSIEDDAPGDLIVIRTSTGSQSVTITPATTVTGLLTSAGGVTLSGAVDLTFSGTTGQPEIVIPDACADGLSIKRAATDVIVFDTATPLVTITPATTITGLATLNGGATLSGAVDLTFTGTTGQPEIVLTTNLADALSVKDGAAGGDLLVFTTTTGALAINSVARFSATGNTANTAGVGITGTADSYVTSVEKIGSLIKTTILIEVDGLNSGGAADDIIGANGAGVAHLGQITAAVNGTIFAGKITCLEVPTVGDPDIDLHSADVSTGVEDVAIAGLTNVTKLCNSGDWTAGGEVKALTLFPAANQYLYLTSGDATDGTYGAGILLIELYGK